VAHNIGVSWIDLFCRMGESGSPAEDNPDSLPWMTPSIGDAGVFG
jgi:hypothetical protein